MTSLYERFFGEEKQEPPVVIKEAATVGPQRSRNKLIRYSTILVFITANCYLTVDEPIRHRITALFQGCSIFEHATQHGLKVQTIKVSFQQRQLPGLHLSSCLQRTWAGTLLCSALLRVDISVKVG